MSAGLGPEEVTRRSHRPTRQHTIPVGLDVLRAAFDALLAQERVEILMWAGENLKVDGRWFGGSFADLRNLHRMQPDLLPRVAAYLVLEHEVGLLRAQHCP